MEFSKTEQALVEYFNRGTDLAEKLKSCIIKGKKLDDKTIIALNEFIIAAYSIADLQFELERRTMRIN